MRLVIVDQSLEGAGGHHAEYALCIAKEAAKLARVTILANRGCTVKSSAGIEIRPHFRLPWTQRQRARPPALYDPTVSFPAWSFLADLRLGLDPLGLSPHDHVFVHSIGFTEIEDLLAFAMISERSRLPVFDILLRRDPDEIGNDERGLRRFLAYLKAFAGLGFAPDHVRFFSDTEELSKHYATATGIPFATLPVPFDQDAMRAALAARSPKPADAPLTVGYLGDARPEKGYQFLPDVAAALLQSHLANGKARLRLQSNFILPGGETPAMPEARGALEGFGPAVELLYDPLDQDEYYRQLAEMDIVILPYLSERYRRRSSGIFVQAAAAGKVIVVPRGTTMWTAARRAAMGNCVFYDTPAELPEAVARAIDRHDALRAASASYRERWCAANSAAALVAAILGGSAGATSAAAPSRARAAPLVLHVIDGEAAHLQTGIAANQLAQSRFLKAAGYRVATVFLVRSFLSDEALAVWIERNYRYWFAAECAFSWLAYFIRTPGEPRAQSLEGELRDSELLSLPETLRGIVAAGAVDAIWTNDVTTVAFLRSLDPLRRVPILCETHALRSYQFAAEHGRAVDEDELALELSLLADCDMVNATGISERALIAKRLGSSRVTMLPPPTAAAHERDIEGYFERLFPVFDRLLGRHSEVRPVARPVEEWKSAEPERGTAATPSPPDPTPGQGAAPANWLGRLPLQAASQLPAPADPRAILLGAGDATVAMDLAAPIPGTGWYPAGQGEGDRHRWTGPEPRFTLDLFLSDRPCRCRIELLASGQNNLKDLSIRLNGKPISHTTSERDGKLVVEFPIPARTPADRSQLGVFEFRHGSVFRPADHGVADQRLLGCAVCSIRFEWQEAARAGEMDAVPGASDVSIR